VFNGLLFIYIVLLSIVQAVTQKGQMVHNAQVQAVDTDAPAADELWSFVEKNIHHCLAHWIALSLASVE
jgi:hypothetical protein